MMLHDTGMRVGELMSLELGDLINGGGEEEQSAVIKTEKTIHNRRVFWNRDTDDVLHAYIVERINNGPKDSELLFPICQRSIGRRFRQVLKMVGITRKLVPHSFRHAFIHRLARLGVVDAMIAQLVGHVSPHSISHYTKLSRPEFKEYALRQLQFGREVQESLA